MAPKAGLVAGSAIVWVGPPFEASAPSCGLVLFIEWLAAENPHDVPLSMLYPPSVIAGVPLQLLPPTPPATILELTDSVLVVLLWMSAPYGELLPDHGGCVIVGGAAG